MDCIDCKAKSCRKGGKTRICEINKEKTISEYKNEENQKIVQNAAILVDNGRAGTLSRIQELLEFIRLMKYQKIGLAYCYGLENLVSQLLPVFRKTGAEVVPVSCTFGGLLQDEVNQESRIHNVSCNPLSQAEKLNQEKVELTIVIGLCLGHDILLNRYLKSDVTTLLVKDRTVSHDVMKGISKLFLELNRQ
ncbi:MAG TPA: hypothetical protein DHW82_14140 [Spirochaetia bacterium]|nr:MAG: hypothetical protein A2Y41_00070 [Spirochaetes bacterium GWB1_36_13]HCL58130.1 hypothetical protein [Spirochaetia bacterium]